MPRSLAVSVVAVAGEVALSFCCEATRPFLGCFVACIFFFLFGGGGGGGIFFLLWFGGVFLIFFVFVGGGGVFCFLLVWGGGRKKG